jgi:hypothetical protein
MSWVHSMLLLAVMSYLKLSTIVFQSMYCVGVVGADNELHYCLKVQLSILCYEGAHLGVFTWSVVVMLPFILFMPLGLAYRMHANFKIGVDATRKTMYARIEMFGFLVRHLVMQFYWFQMFYFIIGFAFALRAVFVATTDLAVFVAGVLFLTRLSMAVVLRPYEKLRKLAWEGGVGFASVTGTVVFLGVLARRAERDAVGARAPRIRSRCSTFSWFSRPRWCWRSSLVW